MLWLEIHLKESLGQTQNELNISLTNFGKNWDSWTQLRQSSTMSLGQNFPGRKMMTTFMGGEIRQEMTAVS